MKISVLERSLDLRSNTIEEHDEENLESRSDLNTAGKGGSQLNVLEDADGTKQP